MCHLAKAIVMIMMTLRASVQSRSMRLPSSVAQRMGVPVPVVAALECQAWRLHEAQHTEQCLQQLRVMPLPATVPRVTERQPQLRQQPQWPAACLRQRQRLPVQLHTAAQAMVPCM